MITKSVLQANIHKVVPQDTFGSIMNWLERKDPPLWGESRPKNFLRITLYLVLYKWLTGFGNSAMALSVGSWFKTSSKSIGHNSMKLGQYLAVWGKKHIKHFKSKERKRLKEEVSFKKPVEGITLWMDSSDFRLVGKKSVSCSIQFKNNSLFDSSKIRSLAETNGGVSSVTHLECVICL